MVCVNYMNKTGRQQNNTEQKFGGDTAQLIQQSENLQRG